VSHRSPKLPSSGAKPQEVAASIRMMADGRSDAYGALTLAANTARTVVTASNDPTFANIIEHSVLCFMPKTAHAATAFGSGSFWVSALGNGTFTVEHPNTADTDKTFAVGWIG
jgi:hypothetical protein